MKDSSIRYGTVTRVLHWLMALLFVSQLLKLTERIGDGEHAFLELLPSHSSLGVLLLALVVLRLLWALYQRAQRPGHEGPLAMLVRSGHVLLYVTMVLLPVTGILYMIGNGYGLGFFGLSLIAGSENQIDWMISLGSLHSPIAWLFLLLVIGHVGAALFHQFVLKDGTLRRIV